MKVLMTTDTVGGVWNYSVQLCEGLSRHDVRIVLATMGAPLSRSQRAQLATLPAVDVHESAFRLEWMDDAWDDVDRAGDWLLELEHTTRPGVVHLNGYAHGALPWSAPVLVTGHSCVLSWWRAVRGTDAPPEWNRYRDAVRAGLHAAQMVAAPTHAMLHALAEHYGPLPHGIVIPNGRDSHSDSGEDDRSSGARPGHVAHAGRPFVVDDGTRPIVLAAGRTWDESKNMRGLAAAAAHIRGAVYIAGSDMHPTHGRVQLEGVHALGLLSPPVLQQWYRRASVFVHPAIYEPFGLAPLEAALDGCALVLGDVPSLREVWGSAAVYVPPGDPVAIAAAVNALLDEPQRLADAAAAAHERARIFTAARMAATYHAAYSTLVQRAVAMKGRVVCVS